MTSDPPPGAGDPAGPEDDAVTCRHCDKPVDDGPDTCEDCAWDVHSQLDGFEETGDE